MEKICFNHNLNSAYSHSNQNTSIIAFTDVYIPVSQPTTPKRKTAMFFTVTNLDTRRKPRPSMLTTTNPLLGWSSSGGSPARVTISMKAGRMIARAVDADAPTREISRSRWGTTAAIQTGDI